jgi:PAS domain S-box-containing protein
MPVKPQSEAKPSTAIAVLGRRSFVLSLVAGLGLGAAILPISGSQLAAAAAMLGALMIMAATALRAARAERQVETLQLKLLDERSYHAFVDGAVEGFFRTTHDGRYLIANPALARMYGYETAEQLQAELTDISASLYIDPNRRNEFHALMKSTRIVRDFVSQIRRRDGQLIWISENARTVTDEDDQFLLYEGTVEDITEKRLSEEATQRALRETQEAARQKGAFLAAMSHELKTPLNAVIGFSDLMRQELFGPIENERYRSYDGDVHENGLRLLAMINSILDFSRIEGGLLDLEESVIAVSEAVTAAREEMISRGKPMPTIALHVPPDLPALRADPKRLHQILMQLLSNAAKFTSRNGRIDIIAKVLAGGGVAVMVRDTGIGMASSLIRGALEPFKQLDAGLERRFEGLGLGLPLANALMRLHGGSLSIHSEPGHGTTVDLDFPAERVVRVSAAPAA